MAYVGCLQPRLVHPVGAELLSALTWPLAVRGDDPDFVTIRDWRAVSALNDVDVLVNYAVGVDMIGSIQIAAVLLKQAVSTTCDHCRNRREPDVVRLEEVDESESIGIVALPRPHPMAGAIVRYVQACVYRIAARIGSIRRAGRWRSTCRSHSTSGRDGLGYAGRSGACSSGRTVLRSDSRTEGNNQLPSPCLSDINMCLCLKHCC